MAMQTYEVEVNGKTFEVEIPKGADPKTALPHMVQMLQRQGGESQQQAQAPQAPQQSYLERTGAQPTTWGNEFTRLPGNTLKHVGQGLSDFFFKHQPAEEGGILDWITRGPAGGPFEIPRNPISDALAATVNKVGNLAHILGAPAFALGEESGVALRRLGEMLGLPENITETAAQTGELGTAVATPASIYTVPLKLAQKAGKFFSRGTDKAITSVERQSQFNQARNLGQEETALDAFAGRTAQQQQVADAARVSNRAAQAQHTDDLAAVMARTQQESQANRAANIAGQQQYRQGVQSVGEAQRGVKTAEGRIAQTPETGPWTSPLGESVRNPQTSQEAFRFLDQPVRPLPSIELTGTTTEARNILSRLQGVPQPLQTKTGKIAEGLTGQQGKMGQVRFGGERLELQTPELTRMQELIMEKMGGVGGGKLTLDKVREVHMGLGQYVNSADPRVYGPARHLYKQIVKDLERSKAPEARQYLEATRVHRQNAAAQELADLATDSATRVNKLGQIEIDPAKILKKFKTDDFFRNSFPPEQQGEIVKTLTDVFRARQRLDDLGKPVKPNLLPEIVSPKFPKAPKMLSEDPKKVMAPKTRHLPEHIEPKFEPGMMARNPAALAHMMGAIGAGAAFGAPAGVVYAGVVAGTIYGPRLIFKAATTQTGREILRTLYKDMPPMVHDTAKLTALSNFLLSQDEQGGGQRDAASLFAESSIPAAPPPSVY